MQLCSERRVGLRRHSVRCNRGAGLLPAFGRGLPACLGPCLKGQADDPPALRLCAPPRATHRLDASHSQLPHTRQQQARGSGIAHFTHSSALILRTRHPHHTLACCQQLRNSCTSVSRPEVERTGEMAAHQDGSGTIECGYLELICLHGQPVGNPSHIPDSLQSSARMN